MNWFISMAIVLGFPAAIYILMRVISFMFNLPENIKYNMDSEYRKSKDDKIKLDKEESYKKMMEQAQQRRERRKKQEENDFRLKF